MRKELRQEAEGTVFGCRSSRAGFERSEMSVENHKRRRVLSSLHTLTCDLKFFDRILDVKRLDEFVFISKQSERCR